QSQRFPNAPVGLVYPGDPGVPRGTYAADKNNLAPRVGAVWDPVGDGKTTARAAWGIFYDALAGQGDFFQNGVLAPPFTPLIEVNPGLFTPGQTTPSRRLLPAYALVRPTFSAATSKYDSLQTSVRMRPNHGINFLASYTLGHAMDHVSGLNIGGEPRPVLPVTIGDEATFDRALSFEWGDALFDVRHRFVLSFGAELPTPENMGAVVKHVVGGWQLNGIVQTQTGFPLSVTNSQLDIRFLTNRPDATCDPNANAPHTTDQWFDTSCFVVRPLAQTGERPGNAGRNTIRGPGFASTDLSLFKNIDFGASRRIQLRVEAFNVFNQAHFNNPSGVINTVTFGHITSAQDGRVMQLAIK